MRADFSRRGLLRLGAGLATAMAVPARARGALEPALLEQAKVALETHAQALSVRDRLVLADYSVPSRVARLHLVDLLNGTVRRLLVSHGRGSDPGHSGWLEHFSNVPGSLASSAGAYCAGAEYVGKHGRSQRLIGLEPTNSNAEARAIVVHGAWYVGPDMVRQHGKLGRSEGCFAVAPDDLATFMNHLQPGTLLFAGKA